MFDGIAGLYASIARETEEHRFKVENNGFFPYVSNLTRAHLLWLEAAVEVVIAEAAVVVVAVVEVVG